MRGVANVADGIVVHGETQEEHDRRLLAALKGLSDAGLMLNPSKCDFQLPELMFNGHKLMSDGVYPGEKKIAQAHV